MTQATIEEIGARFKLELKDRQDWLADLMVVFQGILHGSLCRPHFKLVAILVTQTTWTFVILDNETGVEGVVKVWK